MSDLINSKTGNQFDTQYKKIIQNIGKYSITIAVTIDGKFIGILEIKEDKKYLDIEKQKIYTKFLDVDEYYKDES